MPQAVLGRLLESIGHGKETGGKDNAIGIGLDCAVLPLKNGFNLLQTVDYFYPLVDDPVQMGRITCANVLSDLYAMGVRQIDSIDIVIKRSTAMSAKEQEVNIPSVPTYLTKGVHCEKKKLVWSLLASQVNLHLIV